MSDKKFSQKETPFNSKLKKMNEMKFQMKRNEDKQKSDLNLKGKQNDNIQQSTQNQQQASQQSVCCQGESVKNYLCVWLFFIIAFIVFIIIWAIGHFTIERLTSYYYFTDFNISPFVQIDFWKMSQFSTATDQQNYVLSNTLYSNDDLKKADAIALSLFFSWLMWKLPLTVFTLKIIRHKSHSLLRYATYFFFLALLLLIDIMATIFRPQGYQDWIFFIIYSVLSIFLIIVNGVRAGGKKLFKNLKNYLLPILYIVLAYVCFTLFIPTLYKSMYNGVGFDAPYIIVHVFPVIDFIFYSLIILITYFCDPHAIKFIKMLQFLVTGYFVGHTILFSPDDVEFYYLVTYLAIRNFSFNWIVQRVQKYVIIPCPQPGWLMIYLVSLAINFIPFTGLGKLVVSKSFYSQILQLTLPIQRYVLPTQLFAYSASSLPQVQVFNPNLNSNIQISSIFIIWVIYTITQKYHISKIQFKEIFFYIFGIYLFYFGLTTGCQLYYLQANSL